MSSDSSNFACLGCTRRDLVFVSESVRPSNAFRLATRGRTIHPLLGGEARGEGERHLLLHTYCYLPLTLRDGILVEKQEDTTLALAPASWKDARRTIRTVKSGGGSLLGLCRRASRHTLSGRSARYRVI